MRPAAIVSLLLGVSPRAALAKTVTITETFDVDCDALSAHQPTDNWELPVVLCLCSATLEKTSRPVAQVFGAETQTRAPVATIAKPRHSTFDLAASKGWYEGVESCATGW